MSIDFIQLLVQVLQLPVIAFIFVLCIRAQKILQIGPLLWIGIAFIINFIYLSTSILSHNFFIEAVPSVAKSKPTLIYLSKLLDNISFIFFFIPFYYSYFKNKIKNNLPSKIQFTKWKIKPFFYFTVLVILFILLILITDLESNFITNAILILFKAFCLIFLVDFFKETKYNSRWSVILLRFGFYSWALLQFAALDVNTEHLQVLNSIGFTISFVSKIFIFIGIVTIVLNVEKKKAEIITEVNIRRKELQRSSEIYENIIKNTFHEITFPINSLGSDLTKLSGYMNRKHRAKFKELEFHFERVKAIIAVAKSSYKPEVFDLDESEGLDIINRKNISVNYLIEKSISSIKNSYQKINIDHNYGSNVLVKCNQNEILQILTNLMKNAIEAYENDIEKKIILKSYNQKKDISGNDKSVVVEIEDFASGISPEIITSIWERGFSTKTLTERTLVRGEGLYVVEELCNKNSIKVEVCSPVKMDHSQEFHQGTKFTLYFNKK